LIFRQKIKVKSTFVYSCLTQPEKIPYIVILHNIYLQQQTWKLWGEEKEEDSVYTIYLKKVRYQNPTKTLVLVSFIKKSTFFVICITN